MAAYIVGHNMTGYLPESEPYAFDNHADAKQALIDDLLFHADQDAMLDEDDQEAGIASPLVIAANNLSGLADGAEWSDIIGNMSYWLNFEPGINADEYNEELGSMSILGYYLTCDDAVCDDCYEGIEAWEAAGGFEGWPDPLEITDDYTSEADTPTHCMTCEALIPHDLTTDGLAYVEEHLADPGRQCIVKAWVEEYLPEHADEVADWPTRDQWSPQARSEA